MGNLSIQYIQTSNIDIQVFAIRNNSALNLKNETMLSRFLENEPKYLQIFYLFYLLLLFFVSECVRSPRQHKYNKSERLSNRFKDFFTMDILLNVVLSRSLLCGFLPLTLSAGAPSLCSSS